MIGASLDVPTVSGGESRILLGEKLHLLPYLLVFTSHLAANVAKPPELLRKPWPFSGLDYRQPPSLTWP